MKKPSSSTEDIFVLEMILHGRPERAIKAAYPLMQYEYLQDAIAFMMDDPDVRRRIDAGIITFYKAYFADVELPDVAPVTVEERRDLLFKIISGRRKYPVYVKTGDGLSMVMAKPEPTIINDALLMDRELEDKGKADSNIRSN